MYIHISHELFVLSLPLYILFLRFQTPDIFKGAKPKLQCKRTELNGITLGDSYIIVGDFLELRAGENAVQFVVKYTPQSQLRVNAQGGADGSGVEYDGEHVVVEGIRDVMHYYMRPPVNAESKACMVSGRLSVTNYQLVFRAYTNDPEETLKLPLGFIGRAEKVTVGDMLGIELVCKDSRNVRFVMYDDLARGEVLGALRDVCTVGPGEYMKFFAYNYHSPFEQNGWLVYDVGNEYIRQGVLGQGCGWRITQLNKAYKLCDTYPPLLVVPAGVSDELLMEEAECRSRRRVPVLCWRSPITGVSITRCSQPCTGLKGKILDVDQQYLEFVRLTNVRNNETLHILVITFNIYQNY